MKNQITKKNNFANFDYEFKYWKEGKEFIAGVDEAGRGPLAGPVVAAAVVYPKFFKNNFEINDSKKIPKNKHLKIYKYICENAVAIGVAIVPEYIIDEINIYNASLYAMEEAVKMLNVQPDVILVDGFKLKNFNNSVGIIKGDQISVSIASASIVAKVIRDNIMLCYHYKFPHYKFCKNAGYPTKEHIDALKKFGILHIHRKTFSPVKNFM